MSHTGLRHARAAASRLAARLGVACVVIDTGDTTSSRSRYRVRPVEGDMAFTGTVVHTVAPGEDAPDPLPPMLHVFDHFRSLAPNTYRCIHCGKHVGQNRAPAHLADRHPEVYAYLQERRDAQRAAKIERRAIARRARATEDP